MFGRGGKRQLRDDGGSAGRGGSRTAPMRTAPTRTAPTYNPNIHHLRSIRLQEYDYTQSGAYFVTMVVRDRSCLFGEIANGEVQLNETGLLVADTWEWLATQYAYVTLDEYIVMPNHLHGITVIDTRTTTTMPSNRKPLGRLVGACKTVMTKQFNLAHGTKGRPIWQRNYYERIIRDGNELARIRKYIVNNSAQWAFDRENPTAVNPKQDTP